MRFLIGCIILSLIVFFSILFPNIKTGSKISISQSSISIIERVKRGNERINIHDLIVFNTNPKYFAIVGKTNNRGERELLTSTDSIIQSNTSKIWARKIIESFNWTEKVDSSYVHRGGYISFNQLDSLFESKAIHTVYRKKQSKIYYPVVISPGIIFSSFSIFLLTYFINSLTSKWGFKKKTCLIIIIFLLIISFYSFTLVNNNNDGFQDYYDWLKLQSTQWPIFGLSVLITYSLKSKLKSAYQYEGIIFLVIVFIFPLSNYFAHFLLTTCDENFQNSIFYYSKAGFLTNMAMHIIMAYGMAIAGLSVFGMNNYNKLIEDRQKAEQEGLYNKDKLNSLHARLNPHFLYNSLNSIATLIHQNPDKAEEMTLSVSRFLKHFSNRKEEHVVPVKEEINMILNYVSIEQIRFGDKLIFKQTVDPRIQDQVIPRALLQPLIENAIKYGYNSELDLIEVILNIKEQEEKILIEIHDSGPDFDNTLDKGYGIASVYNKLDLLYKHNYSLEFINKPRKRVEIIIKS